MQVEHRTREDVVAQLSAAVPPGLPALTDDQVDALLPPTNELIDIAGASAHAEYLRFRELPARGLAVDPETAGRAHAGRTVLVTGGTGCIGSTLLGELAQLPVARLVSVSRGLTPAWNVVDGVEYRWADVCDEAGIAALFAEIKPDLVYHLAAQHDPGLAETEVARTLSTNITGSAVVMRACRDTGAVIVHASTGKALRPLSRDVYAASKKAAEWVLADIMSTGELVGVAARFTHVVDNSIIAERLHDWTGSGAPIRLHSPHVSFYLQSAREAAHLLICAGLHAAAGALKVCAIRDLGWPISLMDLALGWLGTIGGRSPVYICGFEAGYEVAPYPGLYDPRLSGDLSPLFNAIEAPAVLESDHCDNVELCPLAFRDDVGTRLLLRELEAAAAADAEPVVLRDLLAECGWAMWTSTVRATPTAVLERHVQMTGSIPAARLSADDERVLATVPAELRRRHRDRDRAMAAWRNATAAERSMARPARDGRIHAAVGIPVPRTGVDVLETADGRGRRLVMAAISGSADGDVFDPDALDDRDELGQVRARLHCSAEPTEKSA